MAGHDPVRVAELIEAQADFTEAARALLEHVGTITEAVHDDVGVEKVLVMLPGYTPLSNPRDFLVLSRKLK